MTIRAVLFDLDNTLTHRDLSVQAFTGHLGQSYAADLVHVDVEKMTQIVHRIDNGGYPKKEHLTYPSIGASVAYALLQELQWTNPPSLDELSTFWFEQFGTYAVAMPQAQQLLEQLKAKGYQLGIISNGGHDTRLNILKGLGFAHYFDEIISSGLVGVSKPHPEIFHLTANKLGVAPEHCVYVGDHPMNDIQGASAAGMRAVWMEGFHAATQPIERKIQQLSELWHYL